MEAILTKQYYKIQSTYFSKVLSLKTFNAFKVVLLKCSLKKVGVGRKMGEVEARELNKLQI